MRAPGRSFATVQNFHMIYIVAPYARRPCKIGIADNAFDRLGSIQVGNWHELQVHCCWWMAGRKITSRIEKAVIEKFKQYNLRGEWFDVDVKTMAAAVLDEAQIIKAWAAQPEELNRWAKAQEFQSIDEMTNRL